MATRLERAEERLTTGAYKKALADLWYAEANHRADATALQEALSLTGLIAERTSGRVRRDAEQLISVLMSDLDRAQRPPSEKAIVSAPRARAGLLTVALLLFIASVILFVAGVAGVEATFWSDGLYFWAAVVFLSLACAAASVLATLVWLVRRLRRRA